MKSTLTILAVAAVLVAGNPGPAVNAQRTQSGGEALRVFDVRSNVHMIAGAGANITVQIGPDGVVLVDAGSADKADEVVAAVKRLTTQPIRYIINTGPGLD
ncbi:MAG: hypothetical protein ACRDF6_14505, partial [bacterium]